MTTDAEAHETIAALDRWYDANCTTRVCITTDGDTVSRCLLLAECHEHQEAAAKARRYLDSIDWKARAEAAEAANRCEEHEKAEAELAAAHAEAGMLIEGLYNSDAKVEAQKAEVARLRASWTDLADRVQSMVGDPRFDARSVLHEILRIADEGPTTVERLRGECEQRADEVARLWACIVAFHKIVGEIPYAFKYYPREVAGAVEAHDLDALEVALERALGVETKEETL